MGEQDRWNEGTLNCTNERQIERDRDREKEKGARGGKLRALLTRRDSVAPNRRHICIMMLRPHFLMDRKTSTLHPTPISFVKPPTKTHKYTTQNVSAQIKCTAWLGRAHRNRGKEEKTGKKSSIKNK